MFHLPSPALFPILMALLLANFVHAQTNYLFKDDFVDNSNKWLEENDEKRSAKMGGGHYIMVHKRESGSWFFWNRAPYMSFSKDFILETKLRLNSGTDNHSYGISWGVQDAENMHSFVVSGNGHFRIFSYTAGTYTAVQAWKKHPAIHKMGSFNVLRIHKKDAKLYYYINDSLVHTTNNMTIYGNGVGYMLQNQMEVAADYLYMKQDLKINLVPNPEQGRKVENLGTNINTEASEIMPVISADGKSLYFVRKNYKWNLGTEQKDDVWLSTLQADKTWSKATGIGAPINNESHNQLIYLSPDGNTMIVGNHYNSEGKTTGKGISLTHRSDKGWAIPETIEVEDFYNDAKEHSFAVSSNRKAIIMSLKRKDTHGQKDLYVSFQISDKKYAVPINLGSVINSPYEETTPFLAPDGKTLYFASEGHPGYGGADIFVSKRLDDTWTKWSEPQNMGPEINTPRWDAYYTIPASGDIVYFVSSGHNAGKTDIFSIELPKAARPDPVALVSGHVYHAKTKKPLSADISYHQAQTYREVGTARANASDGAYKMVLPFGERYSFAAIRDGYYPIADNIDLSKVKEYQEIERDIYLHPIAVGEVIPLNNISFDNKNNTTPESTPELDRLAQLLDVYPQMKIETSASDPKQANTIREYLIRQGVAPNRISTHANPGKNGTQFTITSLGEREISAEDKGDFHSEIDINKLEIGHTFRLENLYFTADSSSFTPNSMRTLDELYKFLVKYPNVVIEIGGHTNGLPAHEYCDKLSEARAKNVTDYLIHKGVPSAQIQFKGYGKRRPIADNTTDLGRRRNQRVEAKIIELK